MSVGRRAKTPLWQISTTGLVGAVILAVVSSALGPRAPWFIERLSFGSPEPVTFTVDSVFAKGPSALDPGSWHADEEDGFAVTKPPLGWLVNKTNPGVPLNGPSLATIPSFHFSLLPLSPLVSTGEIQQDDIVTTEIRPTGAPHRLEFDGSSSIDSIPLSFNPAASDGYMRRALSVASRMRELIPDKAGFLLDLLRGLAPGAPGGESGYSEFRMQMQKRFERVIEANWPAPFEYADNVTITSFRTSLFCGDPLYEPILRGNGLNVFNMFGLVALANPELFSLNTKRVSYSSNNRAMLLDTSVGLNNFTFDGRRSGSSELRRFVLVVLAEDRVFVVVWRNLVGLGATADNADKTREIFQSFRLLRGSTAKKVEKVCAN